MTGELGPVNDLEGLGRILAGTEVLVLDFDGPICSMFTSGSALRVVDQLRAVLGECGHAELPKHVLEARDPLDVLRYSATLGEREAQCVEAALRKHELEAVVSAVPTAGAHELLRRWKQWLPVVSDISTVAIEKYLELHDLSWYVDHISGRTNHDPFQTRLDEALYESFVRSSACTLVGSTESSIAAAQDAGCRTIGYVDEPAEIASLARADVRISSMSLLRPQL